MQVFSTFYLKDEYDVFMQKGRPSKNMRTAFGQRLLIARETTGLSQAEIAKQFGILQSSYADWERHPVALRPDQIEQLAKILNVSVEYLFGKEVSASRRGGPIGKMRQIFEAASHLSRSQQQHIVRVLEPFVKEHSNGHKQAA